MSAECLSDEAHRFLSKVGPDMWVYSTRCTGSTSKRHIIVMFVPSLSNDEEFQRLLQTSCKAAMDLAICNNPQTDIALPLKLGDHLPLKTCVMPMLMAVVESIQGNLCPDDAVHVKLYLDKLSPDTTQLLATMENRLPLCGWSLNTFFGESCFFSLCSYWFSRGMVNFNGVTILPIVDTSTGKWYYSLLS